MVSSLTNAKSYLEWSYSDLNRFVSGLGILRNNFYNPSVGSTEMFEKVVDLLKEQEEEINSIPQGPLILHQIPANPDDPLFYFRRERWLEAFNKIQFWSLLPNGIEYIASKLGKESDEEIASQLASWMMSMPHVLDLKVLILKRKSIMTRVPAEIGLCEKLEELMITHHPIKRLPSEMGKLCNLKYLTLTHTKVKTLPVDFQNLQRLEEVRLNYNQLENIDPLGSLTNIIRLCADFNQIQRLPPRFLWKKLDILFMSNNQLTELPEDFYICTGLGVIMLSNNQIMSLSEKIGQLNKLRCLCVEHNRLSSLPSSLGSLPELRSISVRENQLHDLPSSLSNMPSLEEVSFKDNFISQRPEFLPARIWSDI